MASSSQQEEERDGLSGALDASIQDVNLAMETCDISSARFAFRSVSGLLTSIQVRLFSSCSDWL